MKIKENVDYEVIYDENEIGEEIREVNVKSKWSLKKKLMLGGGVLVGLVLGAVAFNRKKDNDIDDEAEDDFCEDESDYTSTEEEICENHSTNEDSEQQEVDN